MITVLLTDGEFTGLIRTLHLGYPQGIRIVGLSQNPYAAHQKMLDAFYPIVSHRIDGYFKHLIEIVKKENVHYIFPIVTDGLEACMEHSKEIEEKTGAKMISPPLSALRIANDKGKLYDFLKKVPELSSLVPDFTPVRTAKELLCAVESMENAKKIPCIKPCRSEDAGGFWKIEKELDPVPLLFQEPLSRRISGDYLRYLLRDTDKNKQIPPYLVSEYLPGEEWDCDILAYDGKLLSCTTRINLKMSGGLTALLEVRDHPELFSFCNKISEVLDLSYISCISFRKDTKENFRILEINPRVMGNILVPCLSGNNYPKMAIDLLERREIFPVKPIAGVRTAMYYDQMQIS